jgi:thioesterase domain-containing protein
VTKGSVEVFDIPGEHWTALSEPAVALVAAYLRQWVEEECKHLPLENKLLSRRPSRD